MNVLNRIGPYNEALKLIEQAASGSPPKLAQQIFFRVLHARVLVLVQRQEPFTAVLEQLMEMDRAEAPEHLNILILLLQHSQALWRGDFQSSISILEDVLAYTRAHGFDVHTGQALSNLGIMHHTLEQADEAQACFRASLKILQPIGPGYLTARALARLGSLSLKQGRLLEAFRYYQDANAAAQGQDPRLEGYLLSRLVHIDKEQGNLDAAQEQLVELIKFMFRLGNMDMLPIFYGDLGEL